ncbi:transcription factor bHLH155-like [Arachis ipaensis]|uniref:transcription factor bHLH155-like n=1 Tax=Arachis ipaensis TaxID=130454 RepID=UPI000A2B656C|nr:transcription factor bHLH155-like [Arachis ipaensis]
MDSKNYDLDEFFPSISFDCLYDPNPNNPSVFIYELDSLHESQLLLSDIDHNNGLVLKCNGSMKCVTDQDPLFDPLEEQVLSESALTSLCIMNNAMENQHSNQVIMAEADFPSNSEVSKNLLERIDVSEEFLNFTSLDEICQWFDASQEDNNSNTFPESMQCDATSFSWKSVKDSYENCLLGSMEPELNLIAPVAMSSADDTASFECLSEFDFDALTGLLSDSSIEELLNCEEANCNNPLNNGSSAVLELSSENNKMEMMENISNPMNFTKNLAWFQARNNLTQPVPDLDTANKIKRKKEEPKKPSKKKDKAGECSRPRPKDRQRIQDCIQQLRTIIPGKDVKECSIDNLLECSIRYMSFLSSTAHYANKLQEPDKPKVTN